MLQHGVQECTNYKVSFKLTFRNIDNMIHSSVLNYIHLVWRTKYGQRVLTFEVRSHLSKHLLYQAGKVKIPFLSLNIQPEHVHGLINLPSNKCLADFVQKMKGESAYWILAES